MKMDLAAMSIHKPEVGISQQNIKNLSVKIFLNNVCFFKKKKKKAIHHLKPGHRSLIPFPGSSRYRQPTACAGSCSPAGRPLDWCTTASDTASARGTRAQS